VGKLMGTHLRVLGAPYDPHEIVAPQKIALQLEDWGVEVEPLHGHRRAQFMKFDMGDCDYSINPLSLRRYLGEGICHRMLAKQPVLQPLSKDAVEVYNATGAQRESEAKRVLGAATERLASNLKTEITR